jgi:hypothetical protein
VKLNIEGQFQIFQVGQRVFWIGETSFDQQFFDPIFFDIINILDKGFKFVPCFHFNLYHIFFSLLKDFESNLPTFNYKLFLTKKNLLNKDQNIEVSSQLDPCMDSNCSFYKNKFLKGNINLENIPFQEETIDFKFKFFKNLSKLTIQTKHNLFFSEFNSLNLFSKKRPFSILECDKNIGSAIISNDLLNPISIDHF